MEGDGGKVLKKRGKEANGGGKWKDEDESAAGTSTKSDGRTWKKIKRWKTK
jgi:hypothetical protein